MPDLNDIKARLVKISKMTVENGCSEFEALSAAAKISEILDEHGMTFGDVKAYSESNDPNKPKMEYGRFGTKKQIHEVSFIVNQIANLFDCKVFRSIINGYKVIQFFGFPEDVAACLALTDTLVIAMEFDCKVYQKTTSQDVHGKTLRKGFMLGFAVRINERLKEMKTQRTENKTTGTALVVLKNQIVASEFVKENIKLKKASQTIRTSNNEAYLAGYKSGNNISLNNNKMIA